MTFALLTTAVEETPSIWLWCDKTSLRRPETFTAIGEHFTYKHNVSCIARAPIHCDTCQLYSLFDRMKRSEELLFKANLMDQRTGDVCLRVSCSESPK